MYLKRLPVLTSGSVSRIIPANDPKQGLDASKRDTRAYMNHLDEVVTSTFHEIPWKISLQVVSTRSSLQSRENPLKGTK